MPNCLICFDTGVIDTGIHEVPCDCPAGETAFFNIASVIGLVTGAEVRRHFLRGSPEPLRMGAFAIRASDLPGRRERAIDLDLLQDEVRKLSSLLEHRAPDFVLWNQLMLRQLASIHALTSKALGK